MSPLAAMLLLALTAQPADTFVETNPSTVQAGSTVSIRASCPDNTVAATAESEAFGTVELRPEFGFLTGTVTVPASRPADDYLVRLRCPGGMTATTTLHVLNQVRPTRGPDTGFGGTAGSDPSRLLITGGLIAIAVAGGLGLLTRRRRAGP